jgi:hypothetical protein
MLSLVRPFAAPNDEEAAQNGGLFANKMENTGRPDLRPHPPSSDVLNPGSSWYS